MRPNVRSSVTLLLAVVMACGACPLWAQQAGGQGAATTGGAGTPGTPGGVGGGGVNTRPTPGQPTPGQMPGQQDQRFPDFGNQRPIFLSGKVLMDDGTPPPESVVIERICNGNPRQEGYTDSKGRFSIQLGQNQGMMQDASIGSSVDDPFGSNTGGIPGQSRSQNNAGFGGGRGVTERDLSGCELRAALPGFRSDMVNLSGRRLFDNPDVGTIILHRIANVEGTMISMVAMQAPKDAKKAYDKGRDLLRKKKTAEAQKEFEKAVQIYPKYTTALYELGRLHEAQKENGEARKVYEQALAADPKYVGPYRQLALMAYQEQKWQDVADTTDRIIKLDPVSYADIYFYNSVANFYLKKFDVAEKSVRETQKIDGGRRIKMTHMLLGEILIEKKDYAAAAESLREYVKVSPDAKDLDRVKERLTQLEQALTAQKNQ